MLDGEGAKLINDANAGISSPASDPRALASSVLQMISKSSFERDEMGRQGREYIKKQFDRNLLISKLEDFFSEAISLYKGKNVK
jgi:glycosyltransferase involved in cell wall biosynthesis